MNLFIKMLLLLLWIFPYSNFAQKSKNNNTSLIVLGTIQDAGSPHIACKKDCCKDLFEKPDLKRQVVALGVVDKKAQKKYLFEATPNITTQLKDLKNYTDFSDKEIPDGIFITHAHIGHYTGLMYFGKEAVNAKQIPVYVMPKMKIFLEKNGPWSQLVHTKNIHLVPLENEKEESLTPNISVIPFTVPHRDEYSETVGYKIIGPNKTALFIPDIDKWEKWNKNIIAEISKVDYVFIDATFYSGKELNHRDISEIPHPFIIESMELFKSMHQKDKNKVYFIHFNHTNPILQKNSDAHKNVLQNGFHLANRLQKFEL